MSLFSLHTPPFTVRIETDSSTLSNDLSALYPTDVLQPVPIAYHIYDFHIDYKRHFSGKSRPYHFRTGTEHFRMADANQLIPTFEWGLNWCVSAYQQQYLAIHAAVLEKDGKALIMPAPPGSGKSTLCALLMLRGWRLLSDEMCLIDPANGQLQPYVRPVSLKNASIDVIQQHQPAVAVFHRTPDTEKGTVAYLRPTDLSWQHRHIQAKPAWILFPAYQADAAEPVALFSMPKADTLLYLAQNSFNYAVFAGEGFRLLSQLVENTASYRLEYRDTELVLEILEQQLC
ncbi:HprK-related kinase A [Arsukibacterium indicum]|uniref:HprK-related kinase A n=1 Tax=Arsukibacterium indicum TaxID=2848612 RepID=A0ABS6ML19_9GAMM|nr:HprK-related kinase A [Arsukibacterium indicum]MBV2129508.1 HprK-related kinase A [Arsukibacterium indicum]